MARRRSTDARETSDRLNHHPVSHYGADAMKRQAAAMLALVILSTFTATAEAQGIVGGAENGATVGRRAAGPVGGVVGGAIGGVVGGAVGGVRGVLGLPRRHHLPGNHRRSVRPSRTIDTAERADGQGRGTDTADASPAPVPTKGRSEERPRQGTPDSDTRPASHSRGCTIVEDRGSGARREARNGKHVPGHRRRRWLPLTLTAEECRSTALHDPIHQAAAAGATAALAAPIVDAESMLERTELAVRVAIVAER